MKEYTENKKIEKSGSWVKETLYRGRGKKKHVETWYDDGVKKIEIAYWLSLIHI